MAANFCDPYEPCEKLDGTLLITRTIQGPPLALDDGEIPFGALTMQGASLHPFFHVWYTQHWAIKEACYAPVRSVMGLAPGETVTTEVRFREQFDYTRLVQTAMESSEVRTTTERHGRELVDTNYDGNAVRMNLLYAAAIGSPLFEGIPVLEQIEDAGEKIVDGAKGVVEWGVDAIKDLFDGDGGGGGTANEDILTTIDETLETIQTSESQHTLTETITSRSTAVERSITRTFANPYRDRSMELRFIPVFRRFEVTTTLSKVDFGVVLNARKLQFPSIGTGAKFGHFIQRRIADPRIASVASAELGVEDEVRLGARASAVSEHLNANATLYTKRFLSHTQQQRDTDLMTAPVVRLLKQSERGEKRAFNFAHALAWSRAHVRDTGVYVPLAHPDNAMSALGHVPKDAKEKFKETVTGTIHNPDWLKRFYTKRDVHLFMGTHIEAAPGTCVLPDLAGEQEEG